MNKFPADPRLPTVRDDKQYIRDLVNRLYTLFRQYSISHNDSYMWETSGTSVPTTGTWAQGDKCKNTEPVEAGTAASKYVVIGWICTASGTPGTWLPMRVLTGN